MLKNSASVIKVVILRTPELGLYITRTVFDISWNMKSAAAFAKNKWEGALLLISFK